MAVRFDEKKNLFTLQTLDSTYQMKVDDHGVLLHTYYGAPADETDFSYLIGPEDRGFSGQPGDEKKNRTYSMDYYPLEYPVQGNGDFRVKSTEIFVFLAQNCRIFWISNCTFSIKNGKNR